MSTVVHEMLRSIAQVLFSNGINSEIEACDKSLSPLIPVVRQVPLKPMATSLRDPVEGLSWRPMKGSGCECKEKSTQLRKTLRPNIGNV
jgi:hypothetical protein